MSHSNSEEGSSEDSLEEYEENEVVWAKINGYPWWPAYVIDFLAKIGEIYPVEQDNHEV